VPELTNADMERKRYCMKQNMKTWQKNCCCVSTVGITPWDLQI